MGQPLTVCSEHVNAGYQHRQTVDALARHVSIQPCLPTQRCQIHTHAGTCGLKASWKLTYWQVMETRRDTTEPETLAERLFE